MHNVATAIYRRYLNASGVRKKLWRAARNALVSLFGDPAAVMHVHGADLLLPLSHPLPEYLREFPFYDRLPIRLASFLRERHGSLVCIDVGANVGDSIAAFALTAEDRLLAVEPNPRFAQFLRKNFGGVPNVTIKECVCSSSSASTSYEIDETYAGTASLSASSGGASIVTCTVDELATNADGFGSLNFLKIDTDGSDFDVIASARRVITRNVPAILLEAAPFDNVNYVADCLRALDQLRAAGYQHFLVYDNAGHPLGKYDVAQLAAFRQLLFYQLTQPFYYFDVVVMNTDDIDRFHEAETGFFLKSMPEGAARTAAALEHR